MPAEEVSFADFPEHNSMKSSADRREVLDQGRPGRPSAKPLRRKGLKWPRRWEPTSGPFAMMTTSALATYLYGWRYVTSRDADGHLVIAPECIVEHRSGDKVIPSRVFFLPGGSTRMTILQKVLLKDRDPDASGPIPIEEDVRDGDYSEGWTERLSVYHNP